MTIHTAPTDSKAQNGVPTSCGGKTLFYGSIVWLILVGACLNCQQRGCNLSFPHLIVINSCVAIGIEILCLFMGTCFAYDNPSVSVVVTGTSLVAPPLWRAKCVCLILYECRSLFVLPRRYIPVVCRCCVGGHWRDNHSARHSRRCLEN